MHLSPQHRRLEKLNSSFSAVLASIFVAVILTACGKKEDAAPPAPPSMPAGYVSVAPTSVPMSVEAVAQTEGSK